MQVTNTTNRTNANGSQTTEISFGSTIKEPEIGHVTIYVESGNEILIKKLEQAVKRELNKHEKSH
jgi:hypothetical protein